MAAELKALEVRQLSLEHELTHKPDSLPHLYPNLAEVYRQKVANLAEALNDEQTRTEAREILRSLIDRNRLVPEDGELQIELEGALAGILALAEERPRDVVTEAQLTLVAGGRI